MVACMYSKKQFDMKYDKRIGNNTQRIACSYKNDDIFYFKFKNNNKCLYTYSKINHINSVR